MVSPRAPPPPRPMYRPAGIASIRNDSQSQFALRSTTHVVVNPGLQKAPHHTARRPPTRPVSLTRPAPRANTPRDRVALRLTEARRPRPMNYDNQPTFDRSGKLLNSWDAQPTWRQAAHLTKVVDLSALIGLGVLHADAEAHGEDELKGSTAARDASNKSAHLQLHAPLGTAGSIASGGRRKRGNEHMRAARAARSVSSWVSRFVDPATRLQSGGSSSDSSGSADESIECGIIEEVNVLGETRTSGVRFGQVTVFMLGRPKRGGDGVMADGTGDDTASCAGSRAVSQRRATPCPHVPRICVCTPRVRAPSHLYRVRSS
jgi:hypothetical protein